MIIHFLLMIILIVVMMIRRAEEKDLDRIVEINNQTDWFDKEQKEFFVQFLDNPLFLVSESKKKVSAYTLICDQDYTLDSDNFSFIKILYRR